MKPDRTPTLAEQIQAMPPAAKIPFFEAIQRNLEQARRGIELAEEESRDKRTRLRRIDSMISQARRQKKAAMRLVDQTRTTTRKET